MIIFGTQLVSRLSSDGKSSGIELRSGRIERKLTIHFFFFF